MEDSVRIEEIIEAPDARDRSILEIARELCLQLGNTKIDISGVAWESTIASGRYPETVYPDQPSTRWNAQWRDGALRMNMTIVLSRQMREKLEPEEWKPLLASFLTYHSSKHIRRNASALALALVTALLAILGTLFLAINGKLLDGQILVMTGTASLVLVFVPGLYLLTQLEKKAKLRADLIAAKLVGKEEFIRVLRKIDSMGFHDVESLKKGGLQARLAGRPSISKRIDNLLSGIS